MGAVCAPFHFILCLLLRAGWRPGLSAALDLEEQKAVRALRRIPWTNWARLASCRAEHVWAPASVDELALAVAEARALGLRVRVVASGFSWSSLALSDDALIFCERLDGVAVDTTGPDGPRVWVEA
jgi:FAD/FMN-containing dehydrogenase